MDDKPERMKRFKMPMYVLAECEGVDEGDAANRAAQALYNMNLPPYWKVELRPGTPMPDHEDGRLLIRSAGHLDRAVRNGWVRLVKGSERQ